MEKAWADAATLAAQVAVEAIKTIETTSDTAIVEKPPEAAQVAVAPAPAKNKSKEDIVREMLAAGKTKAEIEKHFIEVVYVGFSESYAKAAFGRSWWRIGNAVAKSKTAPKIEGAKTLTATIEDVEAAEPLNEEKMLQAIISTVENESPIHEDVLAHSVARKMGFFKAGRRIREAVFSIAKSRYQTTREDVGLFFWKANCEVGQCTSCRLGSEGNPRFVNQVAMPELTALARSLSHQFGEDPIVLMARHLGFKRLRTVSRPRLEKAWADCRLTLTSA